MLLIPVIWPVPVPVRLRMLLVVIASVLVERPPVLRIPFSTEAPVPYEEQFCIVLPVIELVPVAALLIPVKVQTPVVVVPLIPAVIELAVDVLPIVLPDIV